VAIVIGGILYIISAGNSGMMEMGKNAVKQALWGVVIVLGAWVIVNTTLLVIGLNLSGDLKATSWYDFTCDTTSSVATTETTAATEETAAATATTSGTNEVNPYGEQGVRDIFDAAGININKSACAANQTSNCTDVGGLRQNTINGVVAFKDSCGDSCNVVITAGSEDGHSDGTYSHSNGYKVDLRLNDSVNNYITTNYTSIGTRSDGAIGYKDSLGNTYYKEGDHWDVTYR